MGNGNTEGVEGVVSSVSKYSVIPSVREGNGNTEGVEGVVKDWKGLNKKEF